MTQHPALYRAFFSWWVTGFPSVGDGLDHYSAICKSLQVFGCHEAMAVCCAAGGVLGWRIFAHSNSTWPYLWAPIL